MHWELKELESALYAGDVPLAKRYLSKLKEQLFCSKCGNEILYEVKNGEAYFKGYRHPECITRPRPPQAPEENPPEISGS